MLLEEKSQGKYLNYFQMDLLHIFMECFQVVISKLMEKKFLQEERLSKTLVY